MSLPPGAVLVDPGTTFKLPPGASLVTDAAANDPLKTGAGMMEAAQQQAHQDTLNTASQMHGPVDAYTVAGLMRPESSQAEDQAFDAALGGGSKILKPSLSGSAPVVPVGMEQTAHIAESVPAVAQAATSFVPGDVAAALVGKVLP